MYCSYCGKENADTNAFCTHCGKPVQNELARLVQSAREGNQEAVSVLYEKTYSKVYYTVKSMIKDEDAVLDIVQDTYIKAFTHLDTFAGNDKFLPWVKQIASNTARDWLKKKKPTLFTEMTTDDGQDTPIEEQLPDERSAYIPDQVLDENETKRLIREIIDDLPDDQRAVIGMYYYEELSVREIAESLGATESAVKSRLMYGRKKIEKKVRELEKRGTKLYGLAPIPFLMLLFRNQDASASGLANRQILQRVLENTPNIGKAASAAGGASAGTAAGTGASVAGGLGLTKLILIAAITAVVGGAIIGGGIFGVTHLISDNKPNNAVTETALETAEPQVTPSPVDEAMEQYRAVIANAASYQYDPYGITPSGNYRYALVMMQPEDTVPTLLLEQQDTEGMYYMRAFKYDAENKTMHQPTDSLMEGVAQMGGYRGSLDMAGNGRGIIMVDGSSRGSATIYRVTMEGDSLVQTKEWEGNLFQSSDDIPTTPIEWHDINDLSALGGETISDTAATAQNTQPAALPTDGNRIVLTGTVGTYSFDEVLALQGVTYPNPDPGSEKYKTFYLIVLDTPQTVKAYNADGELDSRTANIIDVSYADGIAQYSGQHVVFSIDPHMTGWPSDTSLPLGEPGTRDIHILN